MNGGDFWWGLPLPLVKREVKKILQRALLIQGLNPRVRFSLVSQLQALCDTVTLFVNLLGLNLKLKEKERSSSVTSNKDAT